MSKAQICEFRCLLQPFEQSNRVFFFKHKNAIFALCSIYDAFHLPFAIHAKFIVVQCSGSESQSSTFLLYVEQSFSLLI